PLGTLNREQFNGPLKGQVLDAVTARNRRVGLTVSDVRAEAAILHLDRLAAHRIRFKFLERARGLAAAVFGLCEQLQRAREVDREDRVLARERARVGALLDVGAVAAVLRRDLVARFW